MKTSYFLPISLTVLLAFVTLNISAFFYFADASEKENNKKPFVHAQIQEVNSNYIAYQPLASN